LDAAGLLENAAGVRLVEIDDTELRAMWRGQDGPPQSQGYVRTVTGETSGGKSCWSTGTDHDD
jgi:hypothetical protein